MIQETIETYIESEQKNQKGPMCFYVYNLAQLRTHAHSLKEKLPAFCRLYYAVKANPDPRLLETLKPIVDGFEVASEGEIKKVSALSEIPMIFGAPAKKDREIETALHSNVDYINVESFYDLDRMIDMAEKEDVQIPILIRVNLSRDVPKSHHLMSGVPTQFGVAERDVPDLIEKAKASIRLSIEGFHFHAMSNNLNAEAHVRFVDVCVNKAKDWSKRFGLSTSIVDVGGGVGINYWEPDDAFDWNGFTSGISALEAKMGDLTLVLEIGRYMTAKCGSYVTEVLDIKTNHDQSFALIRGGSHHLRLPAAWKMSHPFRIHPVEEWNYPFKRPEIRNVEVTIAGELCTPNDVLVRQEFVKQLRAGDLVIFDYAGAYAWTISHHEFLSHPQPEFIYLNDDY